MIALLEHEARFRFRVATTILAATVVVLILGLSAVGLFLLDPLTGIDRTASVHFAALAAGVRVIAAMLLLYLVQALLSVYRYNNRLWAHFINRKYALMLVVSLQGLTLDSAVKALDANSIPFGDDLPAVAKSIADGVKASMSAKKP